MPFKTRRSSTRGTPRGLLGRIGWMIFHSVSLRAYRMMEAPFRSSNHMNSTDLKPLRACPESVKKTSPRLPAMKAVRDLFLTLHCSNIEL